MSRSAKIFVAISLLGINLIATGLVFAGEQGHYSSMPIGVRDTAMPPVKGFYTALYNMYYGSNTFKDRDAKKLGAVSVSGTRELDLTVLGQSVPIIITGNLNADMDVSLNSFMQIIALIWKPDIKLLGADYALMILPSWGYMRVDVKAKANAAGTIKVGGITKTLSGGNTVDIMDQDTGFGDLYVQPLWLDWKGKNYEIGVSYGIYCPTGFYDKDNIANVGMGFLTQQVQATGYYYPFGNHGTALMVRPTWEWNTKKIDKNVQPGQVCTLEYGIVHAINPRLELGLMGYNVWQVTEDQGSAAMNKGVLDRVNGYGATITYWIITHKLAVTGKFNQEYMARDRFEGTAWTISGLYIW
jgi:hypothetical protein